MTKLDFRKYHKKVGYMFTYERIYVKIFRFKIPTWWVRVRFRNLETEQEDVV